MSQQSQDSQASTVPFELSQNQDDDFILELELVNELYFNNVNDEWESLVAESDSEPLNDDDDDFDDESVNDSTGVIDNGSDDVLLNERNEDTSELRKQHKFREEGCGCKKTHSQPCSNLINFDDAVSFREYCLELSREELDIIIKAELFSHRQSGGSTSSSKHAPKERQRPTQLYFFKGVRVCQKTFCFLHAIHKDKLQSICKSIDESGLKARIHGNCKKMPHNSLSFSERQKIMLFLVEYARDNALPLPGRMPNFRDSKALLLPSDKSQGEIHQIYEDVARETGLRSVSLKTFRRVWLDLCPYIILSKPSTDLCIKCQQYSDKLSKSGFMNEEEKGALLKAYENHINIARLQRELYKKNCLEAKETILQQQPNEGSLPCTLDGQLHYSFDYAQQVNYPHHSRQVGPIYFLTPRKCYVFGICCEGSGKQVFYLTDEGHSPGKGANGVISYLHHYLKNYGFGEKSAVFNFDNCGGQNKNNPVLWYALWRIILGMHQKISYQLMIAGHTKFSPDWHFGLWKSKWRNCDAETMADIARTVQLSSKSGHNVPHVTYHDENPVPFFDWKTFLAQYFKPLKNISKYQIFSMSATEPGVVYCQTHADGDMQRFSLLKAGVSVQDRVVEHPLVVKGLDPCRQWYLYDNIREFCRCDEAKNHVAPEPAVSKDACGSSSFKFKKLKT